MMEVNARTARYLSTREAIDPLVVANSLIDQALALQNVGRLDDADRLLAEADLLLGMEEAA